MVLIIVVVMMISYGLIRDQATLAVRAAEAQASGQQPPTQNDPSGINPLDFLKPGG